MTHEPAPRIVLRPLELRDIDDRFAGWFSNTDGHLDFFSGSGYEPTRDELAQQVQDAASDGTNRYYAVVYKERDLVIGSVKIGPISLRHKTSDLVTLIGDRSFAGQGLAKEAIRLGNRIAFEELDLRKLHGGMYEANIPSIKAYLGAGWVEEGRLVGQYLVDGKPMDRILVACFNPKYFPHGG